MALKLVDLWGYAVRVHDVEQDNCGCAFIDGIQVLICPDHGTQQLRLEFEHE
jgi:hypothetical protein